MHLRELRLSRGWSQEQLAEVSGLSVRTIQRIENGHKPGLATVASLRRVFGDAVDQGAAADDLVTESTVSFAGAIRTCLRSYAEFDGRADRSEYWWFFAFVVLTVSAGALLSEALGGIVLVAWALPLVAAGSRRLRDAGQSPWWQLMALVPIGVVVPLFMLAFASEPSMAPHTGLGAQVE